MESLKALPQPARVVVGLLPGAVATAVFSAVLAGLSAVGRGLGEPPPRRIVRTVLAHLRVLPVRPHTTNLLATLAHIGYGTSAGLPFRALPAHLRQRWTVGLAYGAALWAVSYAGWIPLIGALPLPHRDRPGRPARMIAVHLVYGATLTAVEHLRRAIDRRKTVAP